ncbi:DUF192 domain-containing protein [Sphingomonas sp. CFBP 8760]|uniref:DUF192 domain-containing protein n=1 Tax=Sphingomonas sp. CFBP 8760 TaxID=2775282 RepID=UPI00177C09AF|nr:DUF192 domain-containing protein [Sphingomonas sp. CFBP 8760]MBD8549034.1 DUF192 domain-containing protein [Sphingomonas sp. CFBP 8760]
MRNVVTSFTSDSAEKVAGSSRIVSVRITGAGGDHVFQAELACTEAEQLRGLMFRTDLVPESAMLFAPYPPDGSEPRETSFWMKDTPSSLDILFVRADGTIAQIAENTVPFSKASIPSGEPVSAVLELCAGRVSELGISETDLVSWSAIGEYNRHA